MNRAAVGALCVVVCLVSLFEARRRRALGVIALEKVERIFNVVENIFHPA